MPLMENNTADKTAAAYPNKYFLLLVMIFSGQNKKARPQKGAGLFAVMI